MGACRFEWPVEDTVGLVLGLCCSACASMLPLQLLLASMAPVDISLYCSPL